MKLHQLITSESAQTKPDTIKIIQDLGYEQAIFRDEFMKIGINCVIEDAEENLVNWLNPFSELVNGSGSPQLEQFRIGHIYKKDF